MGDVAGRDSWLGGLVASVARAASPDVSLVGFALGDVVAMGLVASIDRIERRFAMWLEENPVPGITRELQYLRSAAEAELGDIAETIIIDDGQLLRRMIARRCIYGVDLNRITVQLSQLSIWIHTFVPGLPLSLLDHNLVNGNALVGVETLDDIRKKFDEFQGTLFEVNAERMQIGFKSLDM